ncbi:MAG: hypothetical protein IT378_04045, partial [Sandaracinaceae bacterium]|nr:hypothetical protein [Sandaracinaceae bacterium]
DEPSAAADPELRALWDRVAPGRDVVLAGRVPARWRPAIARTAEQMEGDFAALTSVRALGAGASVTSGLALGLAARTESERDAERLAGAMRGWIDQVLAQPLLRVSVLGRALRRVETEPQGRDVVLTGSLTERQLEQALDLWDELRRTPSAPPPGAPSGEPSGAPLADEPPVPDEIVGPGAE